MRGTAVEEYTGLVPSVGPPTLFIGVGTGTGTGMGTGNELEA
jgi:hypothetical protein